ncbi:MAG: hypothetical protein ACLFUU_11865 [Desulfobacteraceae bacterium]
MVCWAIYIYILLPVFTLILWLLGIQTLHYFLWGGTGVPGTPKAINKRRSDYAHHRFPACRLDLL